MSGEVISFTTVEYPDEPWDVEVYSFQTKTGSFPDRFQDREDYTEWLSENLAG